MKLGGETFANIPIVDQISEPQGEVWRAKGTQRKENT